jgi:osmotically-inducible protein OsmY
LFLKSEDSMKADGEIEKDVEDVLQGDARIDGSGVIIASRQDAVTLKGFVRSHIQKTRAERGAKRISGTLRVASHIHVRLPRVNRRPDLEIAGLAAEKLQEALPYASRFIKVTVRDGWLVLDGRLEWPYQRDRAMRAMCSVAGLVGVANHIVLEPSVAAIDVEHRAAEALERGIDRKPQRSPVESAKPSVTVRGSVRSWAERKEN